MILHQAELCGLHLRLCENLTWMLPKIFPEAKGTSASRGEKAVLLISTHVLGFIAALERI